MLPMRMNSLRNCLQIARALGLPLLLLCSTDDEKVRAFWRTCGFEYTTEADVQHWNVCQGDLIYMTNTVQMHKRVPPKRKFRPIEIVHGAFVHRLYAPLDVPPGYAARQLHEHEDAKARKKAAPSKGGGVLTPHNEPAPSGTPSVQADASH